MKSLSLKPLIAVLLIVCAFCFGFLAGSEHERRIALWYGAAVRTQGHEVQYLNWDAAIRQPEKNMNKGHFKQMVMSQSGPESRLNPH